MPQSPQLRILLALGVMIITLAYWEIGVRLLAHAAFPLLRTDPEVGSIHVTNYDGMAWDAGTKQNNHIITNSLGYIGKDVAVVKPKNVIRIAVLGDSVVEGLQVDSDKTFPLLLEQKLNSEHPCSGISFEVMNFGVGGTGTFLQYQTFKQKIAPLAPDYVLLFFHDDYSDNLSKSQFDLEHFASERHAVGMKAFLLQFQLPKFLFSKLQTNELVLATLRLLGLFEGRAAPAVPTEEGLSAASINEPANFYQNSFDIIAKLDALVKESGSSLIVVPYPGESDYASEGSWRDNAHLSRLIEFLTAAHIPFWNPAPALAAKKTVAKECLAYTCADHLNTAGHRAMAEALDQYMRENILPTLMVCQAK